MDVDGGSSPAVAPRGGDPAPSPTTTSTVYGASSTAQRRKSLKAGPVSAIVRRTHGVPRGRFAAERDAQHGSFVRIHGNEERSRTESRKLALKQRPRPERSLKGPRSGVVRGAVRGGDAER